MQLECQVKFGKNRRKLERTGIFLTNNAGDRDFDHRLPSQKLQQNSHAFAGRKQMSHQRLQIMERPAGDRNLLSRHGFIWNDMDRIAADTRAEVVYNLIGHVRPLLAKMDHPGDSPRVVNAANGGQQVEPGKKIAGKKRFGKPRRPHPG